MQIASLQNIDASTPPNASSDSPTLLESDASSVFNDIFQDSCGIVIWRRQLPSSLQMDVKNLLDLNDTLALTLIASSHNGKDEVQEALEGFQCSNALIEDVAELVDRFCGLFDLKHAKLQLRAIKSVMCPRFHVDNVPCRLVTTYQGCSTQWLPHDKVDRSKLGTGSKGLPDELSGIYRNSEDIQQLTNGDVALLKGVQWKGRKQDGLVHRSPTPKSGEIRLLLTLDFIL